MIVRLRRCLRGELAAVNAAFGALRRQMEAGHAAVAAEIARQSRAELGRDGLARKQGYRSAAVMVSATTGSSVGDAGRLILVGEGTAPRTTLTGEPMPPKHSHVAAALAAGRIGVIAASEIIRMLDRVAVRADRDAVDAMERTLAESVAGLTLDQMRKLIVRAEAILDPDGLEPKERELHAERSLVIRQEPDGGISMQAHWDAETGAPVVAAVEGYVTGILRRNEKIGDPAMRDPRSVKQMQADALAELCRHGIGCEWVPTAPSTTVVVRVSLEDLENRTGHATIDGIAQPIPASAVRRMAADAQVIPCVLGGDSAVLDWGRRRRLFTVSQKLALVERDGGCAFCGAPPGFTVAHHLRWWKRDHGPTDLDNGILLCTACHHRIHDDGWEIRIDGKGTGAVPTFIPPAWLDPDRAPRRGGRARYDVAA